MRRAILTLVLGALLLAPAAGRDGEGRITRVFDLGGLVGPRIAEHGPVLGLPLDDQEAFVCIEDEPVPREFLWPDAVLELVARRVEPDSWDEEDSRLELAGRTLIVRNSPEAVEEVGRLLETLSAQARRRVEIRVEVRSLAPDALPDPGAAVPEEAVGAGELLDSGSISAWPGIPAAFHVTSRERFVTGWEPNVATEAAVFTPRVEEGVEGLSVDVVPLVLSDGRTVLLTALVRRGAFERPVSGAELAEEGLGRVDLPRFRHADAFVTGLVPQGGRLDLPLLSEGRLLHVRLVPVVRGGAPGPVLDLGALARSPEAWRIGGWADEPAGWLGAGVPRLRPDWTAEGPLGEPEAVVELLRPAVTAEFPEEEFDLEAAAPGGVVVFAAPEEVEVRFREEVRRLEEAVLRPVTVDLRIFSVDRAIVGERMAVREDWVPVAAARLATLRGRPACVRMGSTTPYLAGWESVVASGIAVRAPETGAVFSGLAANVTPARFPSGDGLSLDLELLLARSFPEPRPEGLSFAAGEVERPGERRFGQRTSFVLEPGEVRVVDAGLDPARPGRRIAVVLAISEE